MNIKVLASSMPMKNRKMITSIVRVNCGTE